MPRSVFGELEMVLSGLELQHLIPLFHAHSVSFVSFLRFTDDDLDRMKIEKVSSGASDSVGIANCWKQCCRVFPSYIRFLNEI